MFTGIVEETGRVISVEEHGSNRDLLIAARMSTELKVDQSISHNGVCLTVVAIENDARRVTGVKETLDRSKLGDLR